MRRAGLLVALLACGSGSQRPPETAWEPLGSSHVAPPGTGIPDTIPPPRDPPVAAHELAVVVSGMPNRPSPTHGNAIRALEHLADALEILAPNERDEVARIRQAVDTIVGSDVDANLHADEVRAALIAGARVLAGISPDHPLRGWTYANSVDTLVHELALLDPDTPLMQQHDAMVRVFEAVTRTLYAAYGSAPPDGRVAIESPPS